MKRVLGQTGSARNPNYVFDTDRSGRFELRDLAPGTYELTLFAVPRGQVRPRLPPVEIGCNAWYGITLHEIVPDRSTEVHCRVVDQRGAPLPDLSFGVWEDRGKKAGAEPVFPHHALASAYTDTRGELRISGIAPGEYSLVRTQSVTLTGNRLCRDENGGALAFRVGQDVHPVRLEWRIQVAAPAGIRGVIVRPPARSDRPALLDVWVKELSTPEASRPLRVPVSEDGRFHADRLFPGSVLLEVHERSAGTDGPPPIVSQLLTLDDGEVRELRIEL
jgi:hypothetical protein